MSAMTASAIRGFALFTTIGCSNCHTIATDHALFSDGLFHDTGIGYRHTMENNDATLKPLRLAPGVNVYPKVAFAAVTASDLGRHEATGRADDRWKFLTPSLRNVALTAPYMHDGSIPDLAEVLRFYNQGGFAHAGLDPLVRPLDLDDRQLQDLENFLIALTGNNTDSLTREGRATAIGDTGLADHRETY